MYVYVCIYIHIHTYIHTVMDESIGTPGTFPENAPFLPAKCCIYKCFGIYMLILHVHWDNTKKAEGKSQI